MKPSSTPCSTPEDSLSPWWVRRDRPMSKPQTADPPMIANRPRASAGVDSRKSTWRSPVARAVGARRWAERRHEPEPASNAKADGAAASSVMPGSSRLGAPHSKQRRSAQASTLTARAMTSPSTLSEIRDCTAIASFAHPASGITSVGLNAVDAVSPR